MNRRRGFDKTIQIHRRHGFGEINQKLKNTRFRRNSEEGSDATRHEIQIVTTVQMYHVRLWGS